MFASMTNIPYQDGYSIQYWKRVIDVLIMKNSTDYCVNCTRSIPLKEADQHINTKHIAKDAMVAAEIYNHLTNEKYDVCLYLSAIRMATNKLLIYDISRQIKINITVYSNDARSCYDRIVYVAEFLTLR